jgi:tRNA1(Val) A37 N6-methylase TrmN6
MCDTMTMNRNLYRPAPVVNEEAQPVDRTIPPRDAAALLCDGTTLLVTDHYRTGVMILAQLGSLLPAPPTGASFADRQAHRRTLRAASLCLLAPIKDHRVALEDAGFIGFLGDLYPESPSFVLPFVSVQELHGAWNHYEVGTHLAVVGGRIHPFYGTYAPMRTSHLELFGTWLSQYEGARTRAVDVGTGCGVLAFMLAKAGFSRVVATDNNPNAIESVERELRRLPEPPALELIHTDLLGEDTTPSELIVFNPPWIRGDVEDYLDRALYFEDGLFERFFDQAAERLTSGGRLVLIFSNVIGLIQPDVPHPILTELERGRFELIQKLSRKVKPTPDKDGRRRRTREKVEVWELALTE